jgi:hypothetical protein
MTKSAIAGPRGWHAGLVEKRFADTKPSSCDAATRTVNAIISMARQSLGSMERKCFASRRRRSGSIA